MLGWSRLWGQSGDRRDTHSIAATQLLHQVLDGGHLGDTGSLHSFWWPVHGEGAEKELCETPAAFSQGALPRCPEAGGHRRSREESSGRGEDGAGQVLAGHSWASAPGASPRDVSTGCPGCTARQGLPKERAEPELLHHPGAAEREEKEPEWPLVPSLRAEAGCGTALPHGDGQRGRREPRGAGERRCPALPWEVALRLTRK